MSYTIDDLHYALTKWARENSEDYDDWFDEDDPIEGDPDNAVFNRLAEEIDWADRKLELPGIGTVRCAENFGGEGEGDTYYLVFSVTDANGDIRLFRRDGYWVSHDGGYYDGPTTEVQPVQKVVTVYEDIKKK
jgi:hypothetical protein